MGHSKIETTQNYLRRFNAEKAMERVRDLSWGTGFEDFAAKAPGGFEPPLRDKSAGTREVREPARRDASELPADLQRIVARLARAGAADARQPQG